MANTPANIGGADGSDGIGKVLGIVGKSLSAARYQELHWQGSYNDYLEQVMKNPAICRNAFQRLHDMIMQYGTDEYKQYREDVRRYKFFGDPIQNGKDSVFGLEGPLMELVNALKSAAHGFGTEKRIVLLHGPVGSAKSTIVRLLKKGLEEYSRTPGGALYSFSWKLEEEGKWEPCPMHEEPLRLLPLDVRRQVMDEVNAVSNVGYTLDVEGDLCPACRWNVRDLMERYRGEFGKVLDHVRVHRLVLSEKDRIGIGTFQPKDEKNQDSTELTGDINYRKIAQYGSDSDPRAFNFDGEFNVANRGLIEFIEVLKLDVAFLYDLLGASQEHSIKPKKFAQTDIDEVIIGHTNEPEYKRLQSNELMEAFRDRTLKIDIPYNLVLDNEIKIYKRDYGKDRIRGTHIAPHTIEIGAMWALLTRLEDPKKADLSVMQKLKLYNGKTLPGYTEENIRELRMESKTEGLVGISPRYIQDKISNALVKSGEGGCVNPFMLLNELEGGLTHHSLITSEELKKQYRDLLADVKQEYEDRVKTEVQRAIVSDEDAISRLFANYVDNLKAYTQKEKVKNPYTSQDEEPDERLMRSVEEKIGVNESIKDDFRREIMNYIGALAIEGSQFNYKSNERLQKALELKLFEDQKDTIKLTSLVSSVVDPETQEKIDIVKTRLIKSYGYCDTCSSDVLAYVASIFARGGKVSE